MPDFLTAANSINKIRTISCPYVTQKKYFFEKFFAKFLNAKDDPKDSKEDPPCCSKVIITPCSKIETRGMAMPMIGLGTWQVEPECVGSVISYAIDAGYRHIDTSHSYGNQAEIGATLDNLFKCGKVCRSDMFISAKLPYYGMKPEAVEAYVNDALNCLRLDYIDLFMIHFPVGITEKNSQYVTDPQTNHILIWKALEKEVQKNRIVSLGLSNFNCRQINALLDCATVMPANLQVEMHVYMQQQQLRDYCAKHCIGMTAYAPLGSPGLDQYLMKNCLQANKVPSPLNDRTVNLIACKYKKTPAQVLLRFLLQLGVAVIPKSSLPDRIFKNFEVFDFELDDCEMIELCGKDMGDDGGRMFSCNVWVGTNAHPEYPF